MPNASRPRPSQLTPEAVLLARRGTLRAAVGLALGGAFASAAPAANAAADALQPTPFELASRHNNYYEFTTAKDAVWQLAESLHTAPWSVLVDGEVRQPRTWSLDALLARFAQEDRVYRLRCVEGWSAVVPWQGFPLAALLAAAEPTSRAKFVEFHSLLRPAQMIGQRQRVLDWPYREGLRIDEAMHPLTLLASGMYGKPLPAQNGAPLRLVVPWKYGYKSIKAVTHIRLVERLPTSSWVQASPSEYGFYANVNPDVAHPRWSQRRETPLGQSAKQPTLPFNGYADEVAALYAGLDLARHY